MRAADHGEQPICEATQRQSKTCTKCHLEKPLSCYLLQSSRNGQASSECRACKSERQARARALDLVGARAKDKAYRELNRDKFNASNRKWAVSNQDKVYEKRQSWAEKNGASVKQSNRMRRSELSDAYVASKLGLSVLAAPPALIELKRVTIKIKRLIKEKA